MIKNEAKVVVFGLPMSRRRTELPLPAPLERIRDLAMQRLRQGMQSLFDDVDDTLFDMADRADNNQEQNLYFEAMRDLRLKRQGIERTFLDRCAGRFEALLAGDGESNLSAHIELEAQVADEAMIGKSLGQLGETLGQLNARLGTLLDRAISNLTNPVGPLAVCASFAEACSEADMPIRIKLIVLKLFERHCLGLLVALCGEANRLLDAEDLQGCEAPEVFTVVSDDDVGVKEVHRLGAKEPADAQVDLLRVGSWLEIRLEAEQKLRCKLAAFIRPTDCYIFVNRSGAKVMEKSRAELRADFAAGAIRLLDDALIFDRALESVINLRRGTERP